MPEPVSSWTCPSCGRRVPNRVTTCRCGFEQTASAAPAESTSDTDTAEHGHRGVALAGIGLVLCAAVGLFLFRTSTPAASEVPAPAPTVAEADRAEPATDPAADAPAFVPPVVAPPGGMDLPASSPEPAASSTPAAASLEDIVSSVVPAVVSVQAGRSRGTGFYIRPDLVITNVHVVEGQSSVELVAGETKRSARVMGTSPGADLALLQVYNADPGQRTLRLGSVKGVRVGQEVIAVGSALGVLSNTVTRGIVSAMRRTGEVTLVQTDAAINPGNSGGPLVDRSGLVIGVNTMKIAREAESIGFAVAIDHVHALLNGQSSATAAAPVSGLNEMLRSGAPSAGDQQRADGERQYAAVLEWAARGAEQLDAAWERTARVCVTSHSPAGDRPWFAVYEPNGVRLNVQVRNCDHWLDDMKSNAEQIRAELTKAGEAARRSGVYPGVLRDLRRRHRLDWRGWDR